MTRILYIIAVTAIAWILLGVTPGFSAGKKQKPKKAPSKGKPPAKQPPPAKAAPASYTRDVKPLFDKYCVGCHNPDLKKGGLLLETYDEMMKGGNSGPVIVLEKSAESLMYKSLIGKDALKMPPKDNIGLTDKEIELIKRWIDEGAKNDAVPAEAGNSKNGGK